MLPIKINLPDGFLEGENRCGYQVSEKQKAIWAVNLDLYAELCRVCSKYDIKFQVCWGTLLGAVRHKGFIPWDDDFDVWMKREELDRLISVADKEFKHPYFLQSYTNDQRYATPLCRLRNSSTTGVIKGQESPSYNNGMYIDIYTMDGLPPTPMACHVHFTIRRFLANCWRAKGLRLNDIKNVRELMRYVIFKPISLLLPYRTWAGIYARHLSRYNETSMKLAHMTNSTWNGKHNWAWRGDLEDTELMPFENVQVPVPKNYDEILSRNYGDYMKFPDPSLRGKWHEGVIHFEPEVPYTEYLNNALRYD